MTFEEKEKAWRRIGRRVGMQGEKLDQFIEFNLKKNLDFTKKPCGDKGKGSCDYDSKTGRYGSKAQPNAPNSGIISNVEVYDGTNADSLYQTLVKMGTYRGFDLFKDETTGDWVGGLNNDWFGSIDDPKDIVEVKEAIDLYWKERH